MLLDVVVHSFYLGGLEAEAGTCHLGVQGYSECLRAGGGKEEKGKKKENLLGCKYAARVQVDSCCFVQEYQTEMTQ